jgi:hypothetical protein
MKRLLTVVPDVGTSFIASILAKKNYIFISYHIQPPARLPVGLTRSADSLEQLRSRSTVDKLSKDRQLASSLALAPVT